MNDAAKTIGREELYEEVWRTPISKLAAAWGVPAAGIVKACEAMDVPRPGSGHWTLIQRGWEVPRPSLPAAAANKPKSVVIAPPQERGKPEPESKPKVEKEGEGASKVQGTPSSESSVAPTGREEERAGANVDQRASGQVGRKVPIVKVASDLSRAHPEVRRMKHLLEEGRADESGIIYGRHNSKVMRVRVSKGQVHRALLIMDALLKALEERGATWAKAPDSDVQEVRVDGQRIECQLFEETERVFQSAEEQEKSPWRRDRWLRRPAGRLRFEIQQYSPGGGQKTWGDCRGYKLEEVLGDIVEGLFAKAAALKVWHADMEEQTRRWREAEQQRREAERLRELEAGYRRNLEEQSQWWVRAQNLGTFIKACEAQMRSSGAELAPDGWEARWLRWAREHAERIDPLKNGFLEAERKRMTGESQKG